MKKRNKVIFITVIIVLGLCIHAIYCFSQGWARAIDGIKDVGIIIIVSVISSVILDKMTPTWRRAEIDQHAGEVTRLAKKFREIDSGWHWEGNQYKRELNYSLKEDRNNMKCYLLNYLRIPATEERLKIMYYAYHLGYHRRSLEYEEQKRIEALQKLEAEDTEENDWFDLAKEEELEQEEIVQMHLLANKAKEEIQLQKKETTYETVLRYLKAGYTGKEISKNMGISEAMVSKYKKKAKKEGKI